MTKKKRHKMYKFVDDCPACGSMVGFKHTNRMQWWQCRYCKTKFAGMFWNIRRKGRDGEPSIERKGFELFKDAIILGPPNLIADIKEREKRMKEAMKKAMLKTMEDKHEKGKFIRKEDSSDVRVRPQSNYASKGYNR